MKVVIAGGSGFIGTALSREFVGQGHDVVILTRRPDPTVLPKEVQWDGQTAGGWKDELEGATAVINLSGVPITKHWSEENKLAILQSRLDSTAAIGAAILSCSQPPKVWV